MCTHSDWHWSLTNKLTKLRNRRGIHVNNRGYRNEFIEKVRSNRQKIYWWVRKTKDGQNKQCAGCMAQWPWQCMCECWWCWVRLANLQHSTRAISIPPPSQVVMVGGQAGWQAPLDTLTPVTTAPPPLVVGQAGWHTPPPDILTLVIITLPPSLSTR